MLIKKKISIAAIAMLLFGLLAVNLVMAATPAAISVKPESAFAVSAERLPEEIEKLKPLIPETPDEAKTAIYPSRNRFLMWTHDGVHIMWGTCGNGVFIGTDNLGKRCWGIYGNGIFAGFYNGEFFWGRYFNGAWRARYLFGLRYSYGRFVLFRNPTLTTAGP